MLSLNLFRLNRCDWFICVWVLYYLQGTLYAEGGMLSLLLLTANLAISAYCAKKVWSLHYLPLYFRGLNSLLLLFTIYGFALIFFNPSTLYYPLSGRSMPSYAYIKAIYLSLLPIYAFYYFARTGYLSAERLRLWTIAFFASCVISFYYNQQKELAILLERGSSVEDITNNASYLFLSLVPLMVLFRNKIVLQIIGVVVIMLFLMQGMKRGAILIGAVAALYLLWRSIVEARGNQKIMLLLLIICLCIVAIYFISHQMSNNDYLVKRVEDTIEGNSSGRDNIYTFFWTYFMENTDLFHYLFGIGANGTLKVYYKVAHNDWLEIAVNQGLLGVFIYMIYWKNFYKTWFLSFNRDAKLMIAVIGMISFAKTIFSMSYGDMTYVSTSVLGYALATTNEPNK